MNQDFDFIIVGAGPAGSFAGFKLAQKEFKVAILEAQAHPKRKVCGEYLCPRGVELLYANGFKDWLDENFKKLYGMTIVTPDNKVLETKFPSTLSGLNYGASLNRSVFDRGLQVAAQEAGCYLKNNFRAKSIAKEKDSYLVKDENGNQIRGKILIGADGRHSMVSKYLGVHAKSQGDKFSVHAILKMPNEKKFGEMHIFENGVYIGLNPIHDNELNVSIVCSKEDYPANEKPLSFLMSYMKKSPLLKIYAERAEILSVQSVYPITHRVAQYVPRSAALIGDAAGFLDPLTGEGMYNALLMGEQLSECFVGGKSLLNERTIQKSLNAFVREKHKAFRQKNILNKIFQRIIRRPKVMGSLYQFLSARPGRPDVFIGIIGNVYMPLEGIKKLIKGDVI